MWGGPIEVISIAILSVGGAFIVVGIVSMLIYLAYEAVSVITMMLDTLARWPLLDWFVIGALAATVGCAYLLPAIWRFCINWLTNQSVTASPPARPLPPPHASPGKLWVYPSHQRSHFLPSPLTIDCRACGNEMPIGAPCRFCGWLP